MEKCVRAGTIVSAGAIMSASVGAIVSADDSGADAGVTVSGSAGAEAVLVAGAERWRGR